jgi:hypothetical protein
MLPEWRNYSIAISMETRVASLGTDQPLRELQSRNVAGEAAGGSVVSRHENLEFYVQLGVAGDQRSDKPWVADNEIASVQKFSRAGREWTSPAPHSPMQAVSSSPRQELSLWASELRVKFHAFEQLQV